MNWYYATPQKTQAGPVDETTLERLLAEGTVTAATLVWTEGMENWKPLGSVREAWGPPVGQPAPAPASPSVAGAATCAECGGSFPTDQVITLGGKSVCAACKPIALQRFQEGGARLNDPMDPEALWAEVLERGGKFQLGAALEGAWKIYLGNFGPCLGVTVLAYLILALPSNIPFLGAILAIPAFFCVQPQMTAGLFWYFLRQIRGGQATLDDAFTGFRRGFGQQALFYLFYGIALFLMFLPAVIALVVGIAMNPEAMKNDTPPLLFIILLLAAVPVCAYVGLRWFFTTILILDKGLPALAAMKLSGRAAHRNFWMLVALFLVAFVLAVAGMLALCLGLLFVGPLITAMFAHAYDQVFGQVGSIEKI